jgi:hypothetical protein
MASLKDYLDRPFAGPGTQIAYERALGRFLVAFNRAENAVRIAVKQALKERGQEDFWPEIQANELLVQVKNLRMITFGMNRFPELPSDKIKELNRTRNILAHGHYSQDFFSEDYKIVGKSKDTEMTIAQILEAAGLADDISHEIESAMAYFWFDIVAEMEP